MVAETEFCTSCKIITDHLVEYLTMADGRPYRKGKCGKCSVTRALPHNTLPPGDTTLHFGKHKGVKLKDVPVDYLEWLLSTKLSHSQKERIEIVLGRGPTSIVDHLK